MGYVILESGQANTMMDAFYNFIDTSPDSANIHSLFSWQEESNNELQECYGFEITISDWVKIISQIGTTSYVFKFGLDESLLPDNNTPPIPGLSTNRPPFNLIIQGVNADNSIQGEYFLLTKPVTQSITPKFNQGESSPPLNGKIPNVLLQQWAQSWENLLINNWIPSAYSKLFLSSGRHKILRVLQGYNFLHDDMVDVLRPNGPAPQEQEISSIRIYLINHSREVTPASLQSSEGGFLGLMLVGWDNTTGDDGSPVSAFYDFSAPCPPTCPR
ncbi:MAG: hypothetical protein ACFB10_09135 [Salibacteraceae bacterium]